MNISNIYQTIPAELKEALLQNAVHRIGNLILDENGKIQGFLQSTAGFIEEKDVQLVLANAAQYAQLGMKTNPIAFGIHAASSFSVLAYQIETIKNRLETTAKTLDKINSKVDIGYYSKFKGAIELASHALSMKDPENKLNLSHNAMQLFVETKNIYTQYLQQELEQDGRMIADYFLIVVLSYLGQVKCCLELEEVDTAKKILREGTEEVKGIATQYIQQLLTDNPTIYLHNDFKDLDIDLSRLVKVYKWLGQEVDENTLFNQWKEAYVHIHTKPEKALKKLPKMVWNPVLDIAAKEHKFYLARLNPLQLFQNDDSKPLLKNRLQECFETIKQIMETYNRFYGAVVEVDWIAENGGSYQEWKQYLAAHQQEGKNLMYVEIKPVEL